MRKFDVIGVGHPCVDYCLRISSLPGPNESRGVLEGSWQGGGLVPTGLVSAARCGLKTAIIGACGDDIFGRYAYDDLVWHGVDVSHLTVREGSLTDVGTILSDDLTHGRNIIYRGGNYKRLSMEETDLRWIEEADYFYIGGSDADHVAMAKYAREHGVKVLIDAGSDKMAYYEEILPYVDYFIACEFLYRNVFGDSTDYEANCRQLLERGPRQVVFTFGGEGCRGVDREEGYCEMPGFAVDVKDTVGAGDTFHGAYFYGLCRSLSFPETLRFASAVAAIKCTCIGGRAGIPSEAVTKKFLETGEIDRTELEERVERYAWGIARPHIDVSC